MRYAFSYDPALRQTQIEVSPNCYGDALPLVPRVLFRNVQLDVTSQGAALACAILFEGYCGEVFEVTGTRVGPDYAQAIVSLLDPDSIVQNVDGMQRALSRRELDVVCTLNGSPLDRPASDGVPALHLSWSGDVVDRTRRTSVGSAIAGAHTNALLVATPLRVSAALGLMISGDRCRNLYVCADGANRRDIVRLKASLDIVGVSVRAV